MATPPSQLPRPQCQETQSSSAQEKAKGEIDNKSHKQKLETCERAPESKGKAEGKELSRLRRKYNIEKTQHQITQLRASQLDCTSSSIRTELQAAQSRCNDLVAENSKLGASIQDCKSHKLELIRTIEELRKSSTTHTESSQSEIRQINRCNQSKEDGLRARIRGLEADLALQGDIYSGLQDDTQRLVRASEELKATHTSLIQSSNEEIRQTKQLKKSETDDLNRQIIELKKKLAELVTDNTLIQRLKRKVEELEFGHTLKLDLIKKIIKHNGELIEERQVFRERNANLYAEISRLTDHNIALESEIALLYRMSVELTSPKAGDRQGLEDPFNNEDTDGTVELEDRGSENPTRSGHYVEEERADDPADHTTSAKAPGKAPRNRGKPPINRSLLGGKSEMPRPEPRPELRPWARPGWTWVAGFWRRYPVHWMKKDAGINEVGSGGVGTETAEAANIKDAWDASGEDTVARDAKGEVTNGSVDDPPDADMEYELAENAFSDDDLYGA
ncbi:uncharacterized protein BP5553_10582 [Venustampulla echinocandica]|uniref:Uncharacterized protein n=1 Tax=Venustampulla echinocandica TaxID=2656787 RepID=A0A370T8Y6_9HELO|nr:uncharacterized protein BP5553_10582 [Venustampulla echinocandica]RDL29955.1 hypothetical protein BP5553_10582 [Venustampulla echinocandica]